MKCPGHLDRVVVACVLSVVVHVLDFVLVDTEVVLVVDEGVFDSTDVMGTVVFLTKGFDVFSEAVVVAFVAVVVGCVVVVVEGLVDAVEPEDDGCTVDVCTVVVVVDTGVVDVGVWELVCVDEVTALVDGCVV